MTCGVYLIQNKINNKVYVGSSVNVEERWITHKLKLNRSTHHSLKLQNAWKKYGAINFDFKIIEICSTDQLINKEQLYIDSNSSYTSGYNGRPKAASCLGLIRGPQSKEHRLKIALAKTGIKNANYGKPRSEETKRKIKEAQIGKPRKKQSAKSNLLRSQSLKAFYKGDLSEKVKAHRIKRMQQKISPSKETRKKISLSKIKHCKNNPLSEETRKKMSLSALERFKKNPVSKEGRIKMSLAQIKRNKENPISEEQRAKLSLAQKTRHKNHPVSEETKKRISQAHIERHKIFPVSEETKRKLSLAGTKRIMSEESKKKISIANRGKTYKRSKETLIRMSLSQIKRYKEHPLSEETKKKISLSKLSLKKNDPIKHYEN